MRPLPGLQRPPPGRFLCLILALYLGLLTACSRQGLVADSIPADQIPVTARFDPQPLLAGHEHLYEHNVASFQETREAPPYELHSVITAGGGTPLRRETKKSTIARFDADFRARGLDVRLLKQLSVHHFCYLTAEPEILKTEVRQTPTEPGGEPQRIESFELVP